jgi:hypothetical protein
MDSGSLLVYFWVSEPVEDEYPSFQAFNTLFPATESYFSEQELLLKQRLAAEKIFFKHFHDDGGFKQEEEERLKRTSIRAAVQKFPRVFFYAFMKIFMVR